MTSHPRNAWWLVTRRRRAEWQQLLAAGVATFAGRPRAHFQAARPGDPVLLYVSKPDHALRAVGVVMQGSGIGDQGSVTNNSKLKTQNSKLLTPGIDVQLAFEVTNPIGWRDVVRVRALEDAEPVRRRSSGTLFLLNPDEYDALRGLIVERNPELAGAFEAIDSGVVAEEQKVADEEEIPPYRLREIQAPYRPATWVGALPPVRNLAELQSLTGLDQDLLQEALDLLADTGQIILSGPPGTGKTWLARGLASFAVGDPARARVVQFHPSTTYEDFIEGLKPRVDELGRVSYAVQPGLFVQMCEQARADTQVRPYVLVIDEINRAPLARVFGELLYALEYRGPQGAVELSLSASMGRLPRPFYVPENLLIIGTMNSADRSLAMVDYALRRRFRFVELEPNAGVLDRWLAAHGSPPGARSVALRLMERMNASLSETLDPDHRLGHAYFMLDPLNAHTLDRLWRTAVRPLLREYFVPPSGELEEYEAMFADAIGVMRET